MTFGDAPRHWDVRLHDPEAVGSLSQALFGRELAPGEWAEAIGAPEGASVRVVAEGDMVKVLASHPLVVGHMDRRFCRDEDGAVVVRNEFFRAQDFAPPGFGTGVFARQVAALTGLGVARIEAEIAGAPGSPYVGYYAWARMGFDAPLTAAEQRHLPPHLAGAQTLHALLTRDGGVAYWKRHGSGREAVFDLSAESVHRVILERYLLRRAQLHG